MAYDGLKKSEFSIVGSRPRRPDGIEKVTGKAQYGADMTAPGMLHGLIRELAQAYDQVFEILVCLDLIVSFDSFHHCDIFF